MRGRRGALTRGNEGVSPACSAAYLRKARTPDSSRAAEAAPINGAVNWFLKYRQAPADLSGAVSRVFLGVQIQCAQCHDHKTEKWTQGDFESFTACFARTRITPVDPAEDKKNPKAVLQGDLTMDD